jgi:hypothetical protein
MDVSRLRLALLRPGGFCFRGFLLGIGSGVLVPERGMAAGQEKQTAKDDDQFAARARHV